MGRCKEGSSGAGKWAGVGTVQSRRSYFRCRHLSKSSNYPKGPVGGKGREMPEQEAKPHRGTGAAGHMVPSWRWKGRARRGRSTGGRWGAGPPILQLLGSSSKHTPRAASWLQSAGGFFQRGSALSSWGAELECSGVQGGQWHFLVLQARVTHRLLTPWPYFSIGCPLRCVISICSSLEFLCSECVHTSLCSLSLNDHLWPPGVTPAPGPVGGTQAHPQDGSPFSRREYPQPPKTIASSHLFPSGFLWIIFEMPMSGCQQTAALSLMLIGVHTLTAAMPAALGALRAGEEHAQYDQRPLSGLSFLTPNTSSAFRENP